MKFYIYKITNRLTGLSYIGQHKIPKNKESFKRYMGKGVAITKAIKDFGKENFDKEILEILDDDTENRSLVSAREIFWIKKENTLFPNGYNLSTGGIGGCSKESAAKAAITRRNNGYLHHSAETKQKISEIATGRKFSEEHKKHLSEHHRLKTRHVILYNDGKFTVTTDSVRNIAKTMKVTEIQLRRASQIANSRFGAYLLDLEEFEHAFNSKYNLCKEKIFIDPVCGDLISRTTYRARRQHNPQKYKNCDLYPFIEKFLLKRKIYIKQQEALLKKALEA